MRLVRGQPGGQSLNRVGFSIPFSAPSSVRSRNQFDPPLSIAAISFHVLLPTRRSVALCFEMTPGVQEGDIRIVGHPERFQSNQPLFLAGTQMSERSVPRLKTAFSRRIWQIRLPRRNDYRLRFQSVYQFLPGSLRHVTRLPKAFTSLGILQAAWVMIFAKI